MAFDGLMIFTSTLRFVSFQSSSARPIKIELFIAKHEENMVEREDNTAIHINFPSTGGEKAKRKTRKPSAKSSKERKKKKITIKARRNKNRLLNIG